MTTEAERQHVLQTSEMLMQKEEYELALQMLQPVECVVGTWMKGKIYLTVANRIADSIEYKFYSTEPMRKQHREILVCAYEHLYRAGCLMPTASREIQERLNVNLWSEIGRVENELARTRPKVKDDSDECDCDDEDFAVHKEHHIESMVDLIQFWSL